MLHVRPLRRPRTTLLKGLTHNVCMSLAVVAAFTAAFLSLVNVAVSARLSRRGSLEQWRREQAQPVVARLLTLSDDLDRARDDFVATNLSIWLKQKEGTDVAELEQKAQTQMEHINELFHDIEYQQALLDLLAGPRLRETVSLLIGENRQLNMLVNLHKQYTQELAQPIRENLYSLREELIEGTRADFHIRSWRKPRDAMALRLGRRA